MSKDMPVVFMMLGIIVVSLAILGIAFYYGESDWTWIAQQNATMVLVLITLGVGLIVLVGWLKGRR